MPLALKHRDGSYVGSTGGYVRDISQARLYYAERPLSSDPVLSWVEVRFVEDKPSLAMWIEQILNP